MRVSLVGFRLGVVALAWAVVAPSSPVAAGDVSVRGGAYTDAEAAFVGANFIGGLGLRDRLEPYLQLKIAVAGNTEVLLGFGLRF